MNVTLPEKAKFTLKQKIVYAISIITCIISIATVIYVQIDIFSTVDSVKDIKNTYGKKKQAEEQLLKAEFDNIFTNSLNKTQEFEIQKINEEQDIVYTQLEEKEMKENSYDVDVHIPIINIESPVIEKYNKEIENSFINKVKAVLKTENQNIIYTVEYSASVTENILSIIIRVNLKERASAQRVIVETFNYDISKDKEITLEQFLARVGLSKTEVQIKIQEEIEKEQKNVNDLKQLGYNIYSRNTSSNIYKLENTKEFYISENILYIVYAYGNDGFTSEMDLVVL